MYRTFSGVPVNGFYNNMDRNFEKVYAAVLRAREGELRLTKPYMRYYGYHHHSVSDVPISKRKEIIYDSVWRRLHFYLFKSSHFDVFCYIFAVEVLFGVNLLPELHSILNGVLPEDYPELVPQDKVTPELVDHLDAYLLWKTGKIPTEQDFMPGNTVLILLLEAHLIVAFTKRATSKPGGDDELHRWIQVRQGDPYAIKPTLRFA